MTESRKIIGRLRACGIGDDKQAYLQDDGKNCVSRIFVPPNVEYRPILTLRGAAAKSMCFFIIGTEQRRQWVPSIELSGR
jgi:hypothetical protein